MSQQIAAAAEQQSTAASGLLETSVRELEQVGCALNAVVGGFRTTT
ncbi:hypothetical protein [Pseudomonas sp. PAMC 29040]|nr:hypothetical protein [Pseudomonas sp. PAMC 29040]